MKRSPSQSDVVEMLVTGIAADLVRRDARRLPGRGTASFAVTVVAQLLQDCPRAVRDRRDRPQVIAVQVLGHVGTQALIHHDRDRLAVHLDVVAVGGETALGDLLEHIAHVVRGLRRAGRAHLLVPLAVGAALERIRETPKLPMPACSPRAVPCLDFGKK